MTPVVVAPDINYKCSLALPRAANAKNRQPWTPQATFFVAKPRAYSSYRPTCRTPAPIHKHLKLADNNSKASLRKIDPQVKRIQHSSNGAMAYTSAFLLYTCIEKYAKNAAKKIPGERARSKVAQ
jgi:hypothetical protein